MKIVVAGGALARFSAAHLERIRQCAAPDDIVLTAVTEPDCAGELAEAEIVFGLIQPTTVKHGTRLRWAHTIGTAIDDLAQALRDRSLVLTGERGSSRAYLGEHAFALLLALTRGIATALRHPSPDMRHPIREAQWELSDRNMAIIGYGGAGRAVAQRARGFALQSVVALDPEAALDSGLIDRMFAPSQIDLCLRDADIAVICAPLTAATRHLFNRDRFHAMKRGSILINIGRGEIVEEAALLEALATGRLFGAGLDVAPRDPLPADHPLWSLPNVVVTPHVAGGSPLRLDRAVENFCANLLRYRRGEPLRGILDPRKGY